VVYRNPAQGYYKVAYQNEREDRRKRKVLREPPSNSPADQGGPCDGLRVVILYMGAGRNRLVNKSTKNWKDEYVLCLKKG